MILKTILWSCLFLIGYTYVLYPLLLLVLCFIRNGGRKGQRDPDASYVPPVTMLIAAHNEAQIIPAKIANCLAIDYPEDRLRIVFASDGSDDATNALVLACNNPRISLIPYPQRRGKIATLNDAISAIRDEIIVMSDANTMYEPGALQKLTRHFANDRVGCVCGELILESPGDGGSGEGLYWKYETFLKRMESNCGFLIGATGGIFALRRKLFRPLPNETIVEDFVTGMKILEQGFEVRYEPEARAREFTEPTMKDEMRRKSRIGAGGFQAIGLTARMLYPSRGLPALGYWSHKIIRWIVPFLMLGALGTNVYLATETEYALMLAIQLAVYISAIIGTVVRPGHILRPVSYFFLMNLALLIGFFRYLRGTQRVTWERVR